MTVTDGLMPLKLPLLTLRFEGGAPVVVKVTVYGPPVLPLTARTMPVETLTFALTPAKVKLLALNVSGVPAPTNEMV